MEEVTHFYAIPTGFLHWQAFITGVNDDGDDDARSIETFSTTATADDNPGTGRVLDTYFFQPAGRKIERLAMRFAIRYLHPWRIEAFIDRILNDCQCISGNPTLDSLLQKISQAGDGWGTVIISGLKSLVQQAQ